MTVGADDQPGRLSNIQEEEEIQSKKSKSVHESVDVPDGGLKLPDIRPAQYAPVTSQISEQYAPVTSQVSEQVNEKEMSKSYGLRDVDEFL